MSELAIERAIETHRVAHVTFYISPHPDLTDGYALFSATRGKEPQFIDVAFSLEDAHEMLVDEIKDLETKLEAKRDKSPTTKQIMFLFREKIPIPVDLTWGQASDLIDERLEQIAIEKEERRAGKFKGFAVGMRVSRHFLLPDGKEQTNIGEIFKLVSNGYAHVMWDTWNGVPGNRISSRVPISHLQKIDGSETP